MELEDILNKTFEELSDKNIGDISSMKFIEFEDLFFKANWNSKSIGTVIVNNDYVIQFFNKGFTNIFQYELEDVVGKRLDDLVVGKNDTSMDIIKKQIADKNRVSIDAVRYKKGKIPFWCHVSGIPVFKDEKQVGIVFNYNDRTEYHLDTMQKQRMTKNFRGVYFELDFKGKILFLSPKINNITGLDESHFIGKNIKKYIVGLDNFEEFAKKIEETGAIDNYRTRLYSNKRNIPISVSATFDMQFDKKIISGTFMDITKDVEREKELHDLADKMRCYAEKDSLTGAYNRRMSVEIGNRFIAEAKERNTKVSVLFIDSDDMKYINDTNGHAVGDEYLKQIVERLKLSFHPDDCIGRLGGDEFIVMFKHNNDYDVEGRCRHVQEFLENKYVIKDNDIKSSVSIGVAVYPHDTGGFEDILKIADKLMYQAKQQGKGTFVISEDYLKGK